VADVRSGDHIMGDEFSTDGPPSLSVKLIGSAPFAKVTIVKDGREVYMVEPKTKGVDFTWRDDAAQPGKRSYYYVRGEQSDGQLVWASPMWITMK
jgi:outer membrane lipoprotein-sorting protein